MWIQDIKKNINKYNQTLCLFEEKEEIGIIAMIYRYQLPISAPGILLLKNKKNRYHY